jgi:dihydroxyacetone kinase-like predicted kinase
VAGTAGALPNVADILDAVGSVAADDVVVLPGNPNVVPTARQASQVSEAEGGRVLHVIDTATSVPAVLAALALADPSSPDVDLLLATAADVRAGEVVAAVRDADTPLGRVREGQFLVVVDGDVVGAHDDVFDAVRALAEHLDAGAAEVLTVVVGHGVPAEERETVERLLRSLADGADMDVVDGQQRPARWILGIEG